MNTHLKKYLEIYEKFPLNAYFSKEQRKVRHKMMTSWEKEAVDEYPSLDELMDFVTQYKNNIHITPQFFQKFQSVWREDFNHGYQFSEFLLEMDLEELLWKFDLSSMHLANQVLKRHQNHVKALKLKLKLLVRYHDFCLHELPWGVLAEGNREEELNSVTEMEETAKKLNFQAKNFEILCHNCKRYYPLWFEYLEEKTKCGFKEFLELKGVDTESIYLPYIMI